MNGEPLQIIILQAHAVDTKEDAAFTDPIDVYVDELYLSDGTPTSNVPVATTEPGRIVKCELYSVNGSLLARWESGDSLPDYVSPGVYVLCQTDESGKVYSKKVVK